MVESGILRTLFRAIVVCLSMQTSVALAIELGAMEVRSEVGMPLIAHVQFEMSPQEAQLPEQVNIALKSTSVPDFKGLVRTRVFLQPNSTSGFLRITAIEAAPRGISLVLEARDPRQNHVREYVIDNHVVRTRDIQRPELPKPVVALPPQPAVEANVEPTRVLEPAPPDGIELRLLDQTQGDDVVSPRALASDLELLNKTQAALLADEKARTQAAEALALLGVLAQDTRSLFGVKASREVVLAAMEEEMKLTPDSYVLTIRGDQVDEQGRLQTERAALGKPGDVEPAEPLTQPATAQTQPPQAAVTNAVPSQPQNLPQSPAPVQREEKEGWSTLTWMLLSVVSVALGLLFWFTTRLREQAQSEKNQAQAQPDLPIASPAQAQERTEPVLMDDPLALPEPIADVTNETDGWLAQQDEPEFDLEPSSNIQEADEPTQVDASPVDSEPVNLIETTVAEEDHAAPEQLADLEPPFKNENDARIELAGAYLEIEDFEAAVKVLGSIEGQLTPPQQQRLEQIREEIMQGEARS
ncbi:MAG TPA: hypothetical protein VFV43_01750 [Limnobacter sp.]|nr:hypothetical protein [Limnobacter sp.]